MKKILLLSMLMVLLAGCTTLNRKDYQQLQQLRMNGISVDHPVVPFEKPNSEITAGALNILPGFGNFYLAFGDGGVKKQAIFGGINFLLWPLSIIWGVPQAALDAKTLNQRALIYYYRYNPDAQSYARAHGIILD